MKSTPSLVHATENTHPEQRARNAVLRTVADGCGRLRSLQQNRRTELTELYPKPNPPL